MASIVHVQMGEPGDIVRVSTLAFRPLSLATRLRRSMIVGGVLCVAVWAFLTLRGAGPTGTRATSQSEFAATFTCALGAASTGALGTLLFRRTALCIPEALHGLYTRADLIPVLQRVIRFDRAERRLILQDAIRKHSIPYEQIEAVELAPVVRRPWECYRIEPIVSVFGEIVFTLTSREVSVTGRRAVVLVLNRGQKILLADGVSPWQSSTVQLLALLEECRAEPVYTS
jgi:hypothetical protein